MISEHDSLVNTEQTAAALRREFSFTHMMLGLAEGSLQMDLKLIQLQII